MQTIPQLQSIAMALDLFFNIDAPVRRVCFCGGHTHHPLPSIGLQTKELLRIRVEERLSRAGPIGDPLGGELFHVLKQ